MKKVFLIVLTLVLTSSVAFAETEQERANSSPIRFPIHTGSDAVSTENIYGVKVGAPESRIRMNLGNPESVSKSVTKNTVIKIYKYKLNGTQVDIKVINGIVNSWTEVQ